MLQLVSLIFRCPKEGTVVVIYSVSDKRMNKFLSAFLRQIFSNVSYVIQVIKSTATSLSCMSSHTDPDASQTMLLCSVL